MRKPVPRARTPLTADERDGIVLAVSSAFRKLKNLYTKIVPIFEEFCAASTTSAGAADLIVAAHMATF